MKTPPAINHLPPNHGHHQYRDVPQPYRDVAQGMERQFLEFMISQMKNSIDRAEQPNTAMNYYESLLTEQQAKQISNQDGGLGLQQLILDQIYPQHMRAAANNQHHHNIERALNRYQENSLDSQGSP